MAWVSPKNAHTMLGRGDVNLSLVFRVLCTFQVLRRRGAPVVQQLRPIQRLVRQHFISSRLLIIRHCLRQIWTRHHQQCLTAIKYSVRGRDLGSTVRQAIDEVRQRVQLAEGYHLDWTGEYESQQRANRRLAFIVPITLLLMSFILYSAFGSWK